MLGWTPRTNPEVFNGIVEGSVNDRNREIEERAHELEARRAAGKVRGRCARRCWSPASRSSSSRW